MQEPNWQDIRNKLAPHIDIGLFNSFETTIDSSGYFPEVLEKKLTSWIAVYKERVQKIIDTVDIKINQQNENFSLNEIESLTKGILSAVDLYYRGRVLDATIAFNKCLSSMRWSLLFQPLGSINDSCTLYRARISESKKLSRQDLFHIPFEKRHLVSTKRYSIPGFPALYLADNAYTCWEEFNRCRLKDLWFSRFVPTDSLDIIYIERAEDFLHSLSTIDVRTYATHVILYLIMFPLQIACTQKVVEHSAPFKPEYIVPQLLLQYVKENGFIDGIRFPSSKVDYNLLSNIESYNYVFPVKDCHKEGYCPYLASSFNLTEPTNLELEEILYNPAHPVTYLGIDPDASKKLELVKDVKSTYQNTAFGKIEHILRNRPVQNIFS